MNFILRRNQRSLSPPLSIYSDGSEAQKGKVTCPRSWNYQRGLRVKALTSCMGFFPLVHLHSATPTEESSVTQASSDCFHFFLSFHIYLLFFFFFNFLVPPLACRILVPRQGIEPTPLAVRVRCPNHWTARGFPLIIFRNWRQLLLISFFQCFYFLDFYSNINIRIGEWYVTTLAPRTGSAYMTVQMRFCFLLCSIACFLILNQTKKMMTIPQI